MSEYRRARMAGATYFFTVVAFNRRPLLCRDEVRAALRASIIDMREKHPFDIDAWVLLPDHLHCLWTLPKDDGDYSTRWSLIKKMTSWRCRDFFGDEVLLSDSKRKHRESALWQRRFWEHLIRDDNDYAKHFDYIHYNPVKHGLCLAAHEWPYSSFKRYVEQGIYSINWASESNQDGGIEFGE